jgi:SAM-dependent methyltransferase
MPVHDVAQRGFDAGADAYERARPSYPAEAVDWFVENLRLEPGTRLCDLAAGTGKFTRLLEPTGAWLIAVEPVEGMSRHLRSAQPSVPVVAGAAEALPFASGALDAVTVAQAFHWFDENRAFAELARVLRPGGRLGLVWNARDRSEPWVNEMWGIMDRFEKKAPWRDHDNWRDTALGDRKGFGELHSAEFQHSQRLSPDDVVARFASVSHIAALDAAGQERALAEVREILTTHPDTVGLGEVTIPYRVDAFWAERLP